ncbi:MAG TPA: hypothetical protein VMR29_01975 [Candidatus Binatia bacterium]|nr:hypothetical protein [Candidatus Binatia bacterium]
MKATSTVPITLGRMGKSDTKGPVGKSSSAQIAKPTTMPTVPISAALLGEKNDKPIARHAIQLQRLATASSSRNGRRARKKAAVCMALAKDHN